MTVYLDTSNLLKLYLEEPGSAAVVALVNGSEIACSRITYAEARAGLARAQRTGRITPAECEVLRTSFEERWAAIHPVEVDPTLVKLAGDLAEKHFLRGLDAIQLASAIRIHREFAEMVFSSADERLVSAAASEGLNV